ncbi:MAG: aminotransferase class V-fold PLP-dependent enzyme, partial [Fusobacteriaceae bacterium]
VSQMLDEEFGIITRSGLHCAPLIHKKNNTVERGSVRFSFGYFNTEKDVKYAVDSLKMIIQG